MSEGRKMLLVQRWVGGAVVEVRKDGKRYDVDYVRAPDGLHDPVCARVHSRSTAFDPHTRTIWARGQKPSAHMRGILDTAHSILGNEVRPQEPAP